MCKYQHWIVPYLDGQVEASKRHEFEAHVEGCSGCMKDLKAHKNLQRILQSLDIVVGVHERLATDPRWQKAIGMRNLGTLASGKASNKIESGSKWRIIQRGKYKEKQTGDN